MIYSTPIEFELFEDQERARGTGMLVYFLTVSQNISHSKQNHINITYCIRERQLHRPSLKQAGQQSSIESLLSLQIIFSHQESLTETTFHFVNGCDLTGLSADCCSSIAKLIHIKSDISSAQLVLFVCKETTIGVSEKLLLCNGCTYLDNQNRKELPSY